MKKTCLTLSLFVTALTVQAVSTCEIRVDNHQQATTTERVEYCLTPEKDTPQKAGPEVLYTDITDKTPQAVRKTTTTPLKQKYYNYQEAEVSRGYIGTERFPVLKNDILSERELQERASKQAVQAQQEPLAEKQAEKPNRKMNQKTKKSAKAVAQKPARILKTDSASESTESISVEEETVSLAEPDISSKPAEDIAQIPEDEALMDSEDLLSLE